jgi:ribosomal protein S6--L-glutamate ligase
MKQTTLFNMLAIPHPRTRFYLQREFARIEKDFSFPFVAKIPRASARGRGVFKIDNPDELEQYLAKTKTAYVQEFIPHERDLRVILINYEPVLAYWRCRPPDDFRTLPAAASSMMSGSTCFFTRGNGSCSRQTCYTGARGLRIKIWCSRR